MAKQIGYYWIFLLTLIVCLEGCKGTDSTTLYFEKSGLSPDEWAIAQEIDQSVSKGIKGGICQLSLQFSKYIQKTLIKYEPDELNFRRKAEFLDLLGKYYLANKKFAEASCAFLQASQLLVESGLEDYRYSRKYLSKALLENSPYEINDNKKIIIYMGFIRAFFEEGVPSRAQHYQVLIEELLDKKGDEIIPQIRASALQDIGLGLFLSSDFKEIKRAEALIEQSLVDIEKLTGPLKKLKITFFKVGALSNLGLLWSNGEHQDQNKALSYYHKADSLSQKIALKAARKSYLSNLYYNMGLSYIKLGDYGKANEYLAKSSEIYQSLSSKIAPQLDAYNHAYAIIEELKGNLENAARYYQLELFYFTNLNDFNSADYHFNPDPDSIMLASNLKGFVAMLKKGEMIDSLGKDPELAIETYENALLYVDRLKRAYPYSKYQNYISDSSFRFYESIFELKNEMNRGTVSDAKETFRFVERYKASSLLQEVYLNNYSRRFNEKDQEIRLLNLPMNIIDKEDELYAKIRYLDARYTALKSSTKPSPELASVSKRLNEMLREVDAFNEELNDDYPDYGRIRYPQKIGDLASIQAKLAKDQSVVEYFLGDRKVYAWIVDQDNITFHDLGDYQQIKALAQDYVSYVDKSLKDRKENGFMKPNTSLDAEFHENGWKLYQALIQPLETRLKNRLIIVPHRDLFNISFVGLPTKEEASGDYLLDRYAVSYTPSSTIWRELQDKKLTPGKFMMFSPEHFNYKGSQGETLTPIEQSKELYQKFRENHKVSFFSEGDATTRKFKQRASEASILYIYSHALSNPAKSFDAEIAFNNAALPMSDIYGLELNSELTVLNACETAIGKVLKGEAAQTINHAFLVAGSRSVVSNLWKIDDGVSFYINDRFFHYLRKGITRDIALQKAQQDYIKQADFDPQKHPIIWASETIAGSTDPIRF